MIIVAVEGDEVGDVQSWVAATSLATALAARTHSPPIVHVTLVVPAEHAGGSDAGASSVSVRE